MSLEQSRCFTDFQLKEKNIISNISFLLISGKQNSEREYSGVRSVGFYELLSEESDPGNYKEHTADKKEAARPGGDQVSHSHPL